METRSARGSRCLTQSDIEELEAVLAPSDSDDDSPDIRRSLSLSKRQSAATTTGTPNHHVTSVSVAPSTVTMLPAAVQAHHAFTVSELPVDGSDVLRPGHAVGLVRATPPSVLEGIAEAAGEEDVDPPELPSPVQPVHGRVAPPVAGEPTRSRGSRVTILNGTTTPSSAPTPPSDRAVVPPVARSPTRKPPTAVVPSRGRPGMPAPLHKLPPPPSSMPAPYPDALKSADGSGSDQLLLSPTSASTVKLQGYLVKRGHLRRNWKRRWFELSVPSASEPAVLTYFSHKGGTVKRSMSLTSSTTVYSLPSPTLSDLSFVLRKLSDNREYFLRAESHTSRTVWVQTLQLFTPRS